MGVGFDGCGLERRAVSGGLAVKGQEYTYYTSNLILLSSIKFYFCSRHLTLDRMRTKMNYEPNYRPRPCTRSPGLPWDSCGFCGNRLKSALSDSLRARIGRWNGYRRPAPATAPGESRSPWVAGD